MGSMNQFFIKDQAEEGRKIDLQLPDGSSSGEWIIIKSIHCSAFVQAQEKLMRQVLEMRSNGDNSEINQNELIAVLIKDWSFDEELTDESAFEFLENAPQITRQINKLAADSEFMYEKKQTLS